MLGLRHYRGTAIDLFQGDITSFVCDGMVNAANATLQIGGGVNGAIHRVGGPEILRECQAIGSCATGSSVVTGAGLLPAQKLIHAVGPIWQGGTHDESLLLSSAYQSALQNAAGLGLRHIAFPSISTGIYGFPVGPAAGIAMQAIKAFCDEQPAALRRVTLVLFDGETYKAYQKALYACFTEADGDEP